MAMMPHLPLLWVLAFPIWTGTLDDKTDLTKTSQPFTLEFSSIISPDDLSQSFRGFLSWRNRVGFSGFAIHPRTFPVPRQF